MKFLRSIQRNHFKILTAIGMFLTSNAAFAAGPPQPSTLNNSLALTLVVIASVLLLAIGLLGYVLMGAAEVYLERFRATTKKISDVTKVAIIAVAMLATSSAIAQETTAEAATQAAPITDIGGLPLSTFYMLVGVIALELIILLVMVYFIKVLVAKEKIKPVAEAAVYREPLWKKLWAKMNNFKPAKEEQALVLNHEYDGIRELDNKLPPWWLYGFYLTIIFACVYLFRYHVSHTAPLPQEELAISMAKADAEKEEYLKSSAGKVDENTVQLLTGADELAEGKNIFSTMCAACHGPEGQGVVGPNLTDDYWLHKGGVKDIFKTIKYGVPEKGMKAWKDDFSPVQIARVTSYIKSLHGTKPANAKEPQGELYKEEATVTTDSTDVKNDAKVAVNE